MRTMLQIKKFNIELVSAYLRLIPDFVHLSETFWDIQKSGLKTGIESKSSENKKPEFGSKEK